MKNVRVVFMGTPEFALEPLKKLIDIANVVLVVTKKDAYVGRKKVLTPSNCYMCLWKNYSERFNHLS